MVVLEKSKHTLEQENSDTLKSMGKGRATGGGNTEKKTYIVTGALSASNSAGSRRASTMKDTW